MIENKQNLISKNLSLPTTLARAVMQLRELSVIIEALESSIQKTGDVASIEGIEIARVKSEVARMIIERHERDFDDVFYSDRFNWTYSNTPLDAQN